MNFNKKLRFKMYKSGKMWVIAGVFTSFILTNSTIYVHKVRADEYNLENSSLVNKSGESISSDSSSAKSNESSSSASLDVNNSSTSSSAKSNESSSSASLDVDNSSASSSAKSNESSSNVSSDVNNSSALSTDNPDENERSFVESNKINNDISALLLNDANNDLSLRLLDKKSSNYDPTYDYNLPETLSDYYNQNFHYNNPQGFSNDLQSFVPHYDSNGQIDYWDLYYLSSTYPNNASYSNQWYHVKTNDFSKFTPGVNEQYPTSIDNIAIPYSHFYDENGNPTQISDSNKNGIPWGFVATGSVIPNDLIKDKPLVSKDEWGNSIDSDAKLAYFSSFFPFGTYLAYSNNGSQFHPYSDKPVVDPSIVGKQKSSDPIDFRDTVVTKTNTGELAMYIAGGLNSKMFVLTSKDGLNWNYDSKNDIYLPESVLIETPSIQTMNGQPVMFFGAQPNPDYRIGYTQYVNGYFDNNGIFKRNGEIHTLDSGTDNYAGSFTKIDDSLVAEVGWLGDWVYNPNYWNKDVYNGNMHFGSFTLGRALQYNNGLVYSSPLDPAQSVLQNSEYLNNINDITQISTNNKIIVDFNNSDSLEKNIILKRNDNNYVKINFNNNKMTVTRSETKNVVSGINTTTSTDLNNHNINSVVLYVDNDSIEIYLPDIQSMYTLMNIPNESSNQPYSMTIDKDANVKTYSFGNAIDTNYISEKINFINRSYDDNTNNILNNSTFKSIVMQNISDAEKLYQNALDIGKDARSNVYLKIANDRLSFAESIINISKFNQTNSDDGSKTDFNNSFSSSVDSSYANGSLPSMISSSNSDSSNSANSVSSSINESSNSNVVSSYSNSSNATSAISSNSNISSASSFSSDSSNATSAISSNSNISSASSFSSDSSNASGSSSSISNISNASSASSFNSNSSNASSASSSSSDSSNASGSSSSISNISNASSASSFNSNSSNASSASSSSSDSSNASSASSFNSNSSSVISTSSFNSNSSNATSASSSSSNSNIASSASSSSSNSSNATSASSSSSNSSSASSASRSSSDSSNASIASSSSSNSSNASSAGSSSSDSSSATSTSSSNSNSSSATSTSSSNSNSSNASSASSSSSNSSASSASSSSSSSSASSASSSSSNSSNASSASSSGSSSSASSVSSSGSTSSSASSASSSSSTNSSAATTTIFPTTTTASTSSSSNTSAISSANNNSSSVASSSVQSSSPSSSATGNSSSVEPKVDKAKQAKAAMNKAQTAVKAANKQLQAKKSKKNVTKYNQAVKRYYQAEKQYLATAKLYNKRYYYDFDQVNKHSKYVKVVKTGYVHNSKQFNKQSRVKKLKKDTKIKVNKIVRHGKTTRFNIGHNQFITGLKSFIHKLK